MNTSISSLTPFDDFEKASRAVLKYLHQVLGFSMWMVTRTADKDWIILQAENHGYDLAEGALLTWTDTFCSHMVLELGPNFAPKVNEIAHYANAPVAQKMSIGAYIGMPIYRKNGDLFGTLCAIDPAPQDDAICTFQPLVELMAKLLSTVLESDLELLDNTRALEKFRQLAVQDSLTGLVNHRGWKQMIKLEEARAKRYGNPLSVFVIDLDNLKQINDTQGHAQGDRLISDCAECLRHVTRENDVVARFGGDEFGVIAVECTLDGAENLLENIRKALTAKDIEASVGYALRHPEQGLAKAIAEADNAMYAEKRQKNARRQASAT